MTTMSKKQQDDPALHQGAIEGDRPSDEQNVEPHRVGVDKNGMPDDPVATAEDKVGAQIDESQG